MRFGLRATTPRAAYPQRGEFLFYLREPKYVFLFFPSCAPIQSINDSNSIRFFFGLALRLSKFATSSERDGSLRRDVCISTTIIQYSGASMPELVFRLILPSTSHVTQSIQRICRSHSGRCFARKDQYAGTLCDWCVSACDGFHT